MRKSTLLSTEDYWAIWIGSFLLLSTLLFFFLGPYADLKEEIDSYEGALLLENERAPFRTIEWYETSRALSDTKASSHPLGKFLKNATTKPATWKTNPVVAFYRIETEPPQSLTADIQEKRDMVEQSREEAGIAQELATQEDFKNDGLNQSAMAAIEEWQVELREYDSINNKARTSSFNKLPWIIGLMLFLGFCFAIGSTFLGQRFGRFFKGFIYVFLVGLLAYLLGAQSNMKAIGFGYAAWAILLGLLISNTMGTPQWVKPALSTEFYIKTGLVILGAEILLSKILAIGLPGIFVAWIVTPVVLVTTYWFGQKILKISSKTLNMTVSADMSVCGVSAAVATAAACKATKEELTVAIGLSMIFTSVMMIVMPAFINSVGIPEILGGAWIGGTIDATGAVVAAGAFLGEKALSVAATIKMIQNVLIGAIAFGVAVYFATRVEKTGDVRVGKDEIWKRFPKFILGFLGASIIFSLIYVSLGNHLAYSMIDQGVIGTFSKNIRGWLFCLAFVSIGLSINFADLRSHFTGGKPLILYLCGQALNLCLTLLMAYIMFYLVFPQITASI